MILTFVRSVLLDSMQGKRYRCGWQLKISDLGMARGVRTMEDYYRVSGSTIRAERCHSAI